MNMNNIMKFAAVTALMLSSVPGSHAVTHLNIIGDATPGQWSVLDGILMQSDPDNENVFGCVAYLEAEKEFKFTCGKNFDDPSLEYRNASDNPYETTTLVQGGDSDYKFKVIESANYRVVCNLNDMTLSLTKAEYQDSPVRFNALFMVGDATVGKWSITEGTPMKWGGENNPFKFTWIGDLNQGEFKIDSNIYNDDWGGPWFFAGIDGENNIDYEKITADGTGDRKWRIDEPGKYQVDADLRNGTMSITKATNSGVKDMTEDEHCASVYYNIQGIVVDKPSTGIYIKRTGTKVYRIML